MKSFFTGLLSDDAGNASSIRVIALLLVLALIAIAFWCTVVRIPIPDLPSGWIMLITAVLTAKLVAKPMEAKATTPSTPPAP